MKPFPVLPAAVFAFAAATAGAQVGTPDYDPLGEHDALPKLIRTHVEFIEVAHELFTELTAAPGDAGAAGDDATLRARVGDLVGQGQAMVVETMMCVARSGQKATTESVQEFIYPTEWEPAELPSQVGGSKDAGSLKTDGKTLATSPNPTAFETRNLGSTLEIEPTLGVDSRLIDLRFVPEVVHHVGDVTWAEWKDERGDASIRMPKIYTLRLNTSVTMVAGRPLLVAALSPKDAAGVADFTRKWMVFVRCDVVTVGR